MKRLTIAHRLWKTLLIGTTVVALSACSSTIPKALIAEPVLAPITTQNADLRAMPAPKARVSVAVYDFPDMTGQFAETATGNQTNSRAVTQGGSTLLIKALQDAGERRWFTVLDRSRLDDTLKERQIVTEMRRLYRDEQQVPASVLPPLQHAGIIIQGGITGYDSYTKTGGVGARYLGIGGDTKWQQDTVTVTLRAVSTNTGEVLASVVVHKAIASISMQAGIFRYVALDRILEAEAGMTQNEPKQVAVQQAIEKAVRSLIIEGAELQVWKFNNQQAGDALIQAYRQEKYGAVVPAAAQTVQLPATPNPAHVVPTTPRTRPVAIVPTTPAPAQPAAPAVPPEPGADEVLG
jgi:curli production assembly/transport component CsgG